MNSQKSQRGRTHYYGEKYKFFTAIIALYAMMAVWVLKTTKPNRT